SRWGSGPATRPPGPPGATTTTCSSSRPRSAGKRTRRGAASSRLMRRLPPLPDPRVKATRAAAPAAAHPHADHCHKGSIAMHPLLRLAISGPLALAAVAAPADPAGPRVRGSGSYPFQYSAGRFVDLGFKVDARIANDRAVRGTVWAERL